jgi:sulfur relay (sulfurtransferase) DsrF/TusC family protein
MGKRILQILTTGYRGTLEEQDDQVLWLVHMLHSNGAETDVLLRGAATNYIVRNQDARGLAIGDRAQTQPPDIAGEVRALTRKGVRVFAIADELRARGIQRSETLEDIAYIASSELPKLLRSYDQIWQW